MGLTILNKDWKNAGKPVVVSNPPPGQSQIYNVYWDNDLEKVTVEKDSESE